MYTVVSFTAVIRVVTQCFYPMLFQHGPKQVWDWKNFANSLKVHNSDWELTRHVLRSGIFKQNKREREVKKK